MGNAVITNISRRPHIKTALDLGVTYDTTPVQVQRAVAILQEIYRAHPHTADLIVSFDKFADSSLNLKVIHWWAGTDYKAYMAGMQAFNLAIKERFEAEGIEFAFPTRTLYLKQDSEGRPRLPSRPARKGTELLRLQSPETLIQKFGTKRPSARKYRKQLYYLLPRGSSPTLAPHEINTFRQQDIQTWHFPTDSFRHRRPGGNRSSLPSEHICGFDQKNSSGLVRGTAPRICIQ